MLSCSLILSPCVSFLLLDLQVCSAGSRLLVQETCADTLVNKLKDRMKQLRLGDSLDKCVDMGAIVDASQKKSIATLVEEARSEGAEVGCLQGLLMN